MVRSEIVQPLLCFYLVICDDEAVSVDLGEDEISLDFDVDQNVIINTKKAIRRDCEELGLFVTKSEREKIDDIVTHGDKRGENRRSAKLPTGKGIYFVFVGENV